MSDASQVDVIRHSGVFDTDFYIRHNGLSHLELTDPVAHYYEIGENLGYKPSFLFDPQWYRTTYNRLDAGSSLVDYLLYGEAAGHSPSLLFDAPWYRTHFAADVPLNHYMGNRRSNNVSPNPYFDTVY